MRLEIRLTPPKRNRHKEKPYSCFVSSIIAKHYDRLREEFNKGKEGNFGSMSFEDIFQETILYVIQDKTAFNLSEKEILDHFKYRYKMIQYQIIQDSKLIYYTDAYNIQAPEQTE
ncbi:hypothetical protein JGH11_10815 [Dysgonomonas sp. Marseille-P4677]|uniref:hypothetical protein n=1 Tax=Dysgonomonas sp. Marseille-P4677 TaxID=2364790 RepID=UPI001912AE53|nr:hypothetical protein [Dysgonomonas sp. Marseille-P4677]MBK5721364.1 hypothetical protein [Dysgonomonas sp. Marseille-P4677]